MFSTRFYGITAWVLIIYCALLSGCASSLKYTEITKNDRSYQSGIYFATRTDAKVLASAFDDSDANWGHGYAVVLAPFAVIDLPISTVFDTLTLPYDIVHADDARKSETHNQIPR